MMQRVKLILILVLMLLASGCQANQSIQIDDIPPYNGELWITVNDNIPYFTEDDLIDAAIDFEYYAPLDEFGRAVLAYASISTDLMPTKERGSISNIKPSGWHSFELSDGSWLYNRCHLIGYQLTGENANERNLITGTVYFNTKGMLMIENYVAGYIEETDNHVLYRVTPVYEGSDLVAQGVLMEALSIEDEGEGIKLCVFVYNVQDGITIDYASGEAEEIKETEDENNALYILNTNTQKFHDPSCPSVNDIKNENRQEFAGSRSKLLDKGYTPCKICQP